MINRILRNNYLLFLFFFLFLWGGQLSSAMAAKGDSMVNYYLIPLYFCFFSRAIIWFLILRNMQLVRAYTFSSINYLFIPFISHFFLGEVLQPKHLYGGLFIIAGILLYRMGEARRKTPERGISPV